MPTSFPRLLQWEKYVIRRINRLHWLLPLLMRPSMIDTVWAGLPSSLYCLNISFVMLAFLLVGLVNLWSMPEWARLQSSLWWTPQFGKHNADVVIQRFYEGWSAKHTLAPKCPGSWEVGQSLGGVPVGVDTSSMAFLACKTSPLQGWGGMGGTGWYTQRRGSFFFPFLWFFAEKSLKLYVWSNYFQKREPCGFSWRPTNATKTKRFW